MLFGGKEEWAEEEGKRRGGEEGRIKTHNPSKVELAEREVRARNKLTFQKMSDHEERLKNLETSLVALRTCVEEMLKSNQHLLLAVVDIRLGLELLSASAAKGKSKKEPHNKS